MPYCCIILFASTYATASIHYSKLSEQFPRPILSTEYLSCVLEEATKVSRFMYDVSSALRLHTDLDRYNYDVTLILPNTVMRGQLIIGARAVSSQK